MVKKFFGLNSKLAFENFFDRAKVIDAVDRKTAAAMSQIGAFTMRTARKSVKRSTSQTLISPPERPVRTHTGIYKKTIFFEYDKRKQVMICGPKKLPIKTSIRPQGKTTPQMLEEGGTATPLRQQFVRVRNRGRGRRKRFRKSKKRFIYIPLPMRPFKYRARPTMQLAKKKEFTNPKLEHAFGVIGFRTR